MSTQKYKYKVNFEKMSGEEIEDYLNNAPTALIAVKHLWNYVRQQGRPYDYCWYGLEIRPNSLDIDVLVAIVMGFNDWDSDFEADCMQELGKAVGIYSFDDYETWGDVAEDLGERLGVDLYTYGNY